MKAVTRGQLSEMVARFASQVQWDEVDGASLQTEVINLTPEEFGNRFTQFLQNGAQFSFGEMKVATKPFDPAQFIGKGWSLITEEHGVRNDALTEVDFSKASYETCLKDGESSIKGEEKLKRMKENANIRLGATAFMGLWEDYQAHKENSILERFYREQKITYLDFFGDILLAPDGHRGVLCLYRLDGGWYWGYRWLERGWSAGFRSASLAS